jgi:DNA modification methylase
VTWHVHLGDCLEVMASLPERSVDAIVTDPPYGLAFMGKAWDHAVPGPEFFAAMLRVAKPGALLFAFGGSRLYHRMTCAIEDAGWEVRDCLTWLYGSGFPKSLAIDKAIDRRRDDRENVLRVTAWIREARDAAGLTNRDLDAPFGFAGMAGHWTSAASQPTVPTLEQVPALLEVLGVEPPAEIRALLWTLNGRKGQPGDAWARREVIGSGFGVDTRKQRIACATVAQGLDGSAHRHFDITAPATALARRFAGYGTALKPAWEPIVLAMAPLDGKFADNAERWGVAGLNIDAGRIGGGPSPAAQRRASSPAPSLRAAQRAAAGAPVVDRSSAERYAQPRAGEQSGRWPANVVLSEETAEALDELVGERRTGELRPEHQANGGFAGSRNAYGSAQTGGTGSFLASRGGPSRFFYTAKAGSEERTDGNTHPTVKPTDLMRWLVRLARPPGGGVILDPFTGSGSTGVACVKEGVSFIGIEREPEYHRIAEARIRRALGTEAEVVATTAEGERIVQRGLFEEARS